MASPTDEEPVQLDAAAVDRAAANVGKLTERPEWLLDPKAAETQEAAAGVREFLKVCFDAAQLLAPAHVVEESDLGAAGVVVDGFDADQIWEELEVQNVPLRRHLRQQLKKLAAAPKDALLLSAPEPAAPVKGGKKAKGAGAEASEGDSADEDLPSVPSKTTTRSKAAKPLKGKKAGKKAKEEEGEEKEEKAEGDKFFSMEDFEKFADAADHMRLDEDADAEDFGLLEAADLGDEDGEVMFSDFFSADGPSSSKDKKAGDDEDDAMSGDDGEEGEEEDAEGDESEGGLPDGDEEELSDEERMLEAKIQQLKANDPGSEEEDEEEEEEAKQKEAEEDDVTGAEDEDDDGEAKIAKGARSLYDMDKNLRKLEDDVAKLEEEQMEEKPWALKGEVSAKQRPLNSLLEVHLDQPMSQFAGRRAEQTAAAGGVGEEDDEALEQIPGGDKLPKKSSFDVDMIIRTRIWDETFDDVVRKFGEAPSKRADGAEDDVVESLNFEKSRVGLGDVYAKDYETQLLGHKTDGEEKEDKEKAETRSLFAKLMYKLDMLTNAHFTPRPPSLGLTADQVAKVPSLKMEETIPLMVSQAQAKAPEEIRAPRRHEREQEELNHEERVAARRGKKQSRKKDLAKRAQEGELSLKGLREREAKLVAKNAEAKAEKARQGQIKERKTRIKASDLLAQAAATVADGSSRKEAQKAERAVRPDGTPAAKKLKL